MMLGGEGDGKALREIGWSSNVIDLNVNSTL